MKRACRTTTLPWSPHDPVQSRSPSSAGLAIIALAPVKEASSSASFGVKVNKLALAGAPPSRELASAPSRPARAISSPALRAKTVNLSRLSVAVPSPSYRTAANPFFELQGRSIAAGNQPKAAELGTQWFPDEPKELVASPSRGRSPAHAAAAAAAGRPAAAGGLAGGVSGTAIAPGPGIAGAEAGAPFELRVRSPAGDDLASFPDARATWTGAEVLQHLLKALPPGPPSRVYHLVCADGRTLGRSSVLGPPGSGPMELTAVARSNEAFAELGRAREQAEKLEKQSLAELRCFAKPPLLVQMVTNAVLAALGEQCNWDTWKRAAGQPGFVKRLAGFDVENRTGEVLAALAPYVSRDDFNEDTVQRCSLGAMILCSWCRSVHAYCHGAEVV